MNAGSKHSDTIFLILIILALLIGAAGMYYQWHVVESYWTTNFDVYSDEIDPNKIVALPSGRDTMIVPIDDPLFAHTAVVEPHFSPVEPVMVVDTNGVQRAYPLQILAAHEIVNDWLGELPVAVTFCPLCNSAVVYRREIDDQVLRMGVSGNFYGNNFLMYDDITQSWWYQFTGEAVIGDYTGRTLEIVPSQVVGFRAYVERYPNGEVLVGDGNNTGINYQLSTLSTYQSSRAPAISHGEYDRRLASMERVLSTTIDDIPVAYPFNALQQHGVVNDTVAGKDIVVFWMPGTANTRDISATDDFGQAAAYRRVLNGETLTFRSEDGRIFDNQTDSEWNIFGEAIAGALAGAALPDLQCFTHFWFAWSSAHPDTLVFDG